MSLLHHWHSRRRIVAVPFMTRVALRHRTPVRWLVRPLAAVVLSLVLTSIAVAEPTAAAPPTTAASPASASRTAPEARAAEPAVPTPQPEDLRDVTSWVQYKTSNHIASLPTESRLFYRRGLIARQSNLDEEAFALVRGASDLDPSFLQPHLTLASWLLVREPSLALLQYASALELVRQSFNLQLELAANAVLLGLQALFVGLLAAALLVVWLRREDLLHAWREHLARFVSRPAARIWSWVLLLSPFALGFGLAVPALALLGMLWYSLRFRERALFVMLLVVTLSAPFASGVLQRLALPLRTEGPPFYGVPTIQNEIYNPAAQARYQRLLGNDPDNAFLQFGLAWTARRGGDLATAERAYRRALELWPQNDRLLNNLGNTLAMQGRATDALDMYQKSVEANPLNAAAWFNQAQIFTQRYQYQQATAAMTRASALNFELVKTLQSQAAQDGLLPLADQWPEPRTFWTALTRYPGSRPLGSAIPLELRRHLETSGWAISLIALLASAAGIAIGTWSHRRLPLRTCGGCGRVVCRRCAERRREAAFCRDCTTLEARAENPEFSHVLLNQNRLQRMRRMHLWRTAVAAILPGYGLLAHRRVFTAVMLLAFTWTLVRAWFGLTAPFALEPRLALPGEEVPAAAILAALSLVYLVSLAGYFRMVGKEQDRESQLNAVQRGRITQATRRASSLAA